MTQPKTYKAIGLMSGTSADGIDACLVSFRGVTPSLEWKVEEFITLPYSTAVRETILRVCHSKADTREVCLVNALLGDMFADAVEELLRSVCLKAEEIDLVASHGQTVWHQPEAMNIANRQVRGTLQLGDSSRIAVRTGITTISNFRSADIALGGEGAPLVPYTDWTLLRSSDENRIILNIGGIANCTLLKAGEDDDSVLAFDTGPGNMLLDLAAVRATDGKQRADIDGRIAAGGSVDGRLLEQLMETEFLRRKPPKSTGRELFGHGFLMDILKNRSDLTAEDLQATLTAFTAQSIADAWERFVLSGLEGDVRAYVCGGGARNPVLMHMLADAVPDVSIQALEVLGMSGEAKEAVSFALLGYLTMQGRPGNLPKVTGASRKTILGDITPGNDFKGLFDG